MCFSHKKDCHSIIPGNGSKQEVWPPSLSLLFVRYVRSYILNCPIFACSQTNLTAPSADTSPKRATVDTRTSVPSTTRASTGLRCEAASPPRLEGVPGLAATFSPTALCWPPWGCCSRHPQSVTPTPSPPPPTGGPELCSMTGVRRALFWSSLQRRLQDHHCSIQLPPGSSSPLASWLRNRKPLWCCFLCICPPSPGYRPGFLRALEQFPTIPSSLLVFKSFSCDTPAPAWSAALWRSPGWLTWGQVRMTGAESLPERPRSPLLDLVVPASVAWSPPLWSVVTVLCETLHSPAPNPRSLSQCPWHFRDFPTLA